ncbi:NAD(P)-binding domain-containing protein [Jiella pelagia]|uniref:NAD(P)/FAD-dependent oxidoreductase n=1 Tax=Jiella pelagia TaxID=2986949 RepID=A0ABY7C960_9HYPH|nr:NAD(P)/FAD-dependent oxidoreductase [Jiella pelagia]WAP71335.1 NAD(P)/FAD-dependent oxidoreductase [Jiella pelagia]
MLEDRLSTIDGRGLAALEARLDEDLGHLCYPGKDWVPPRTGVTDVVIIGAGMCGMVAWLALTTGGMRNIRVLDRSPVGYEGPWLNYARMETLRSPKQLTGPAFGHGALTFQAWYRAQFGAQAWETLDKIPRPMWMEYLRWYRKALNVPVENGVSVDRVVAEGDLLRLHLSGAPEDTILVRKLIFATGRDGLGGPNIPSFVEQLPRELWAHTADEIDFGALKGKRVAVIGVGASAVDNAAEALEHGAAEVRHLIRRKEMPTINKMMGIGSYGFTCGFADLPDEWRWRFMQYSFSTQTPPPHGSTLRVSRHPNAYFHFGKSVSATEKRGHAVRIGLDDGTSHEADFLILGTGFNVDPFARTELGEAAGEILLWEDVYTPPEDEQRSDLGRFPYLNGDFTFREKVSGAAPWLKNIYCFNYAATASMGKVSGDIPGVSEGADWLSRSVASTLYAEDVALHWQSMLAYDTPELVGDEWEPSDLQAAAMEGKVA